MKGKKFSFLLALTLAVAPVLTACGGADENIYILFTNDTHGAYAENIGFAGVASYRDGLKAGRQHVTLVDLGDACGGDFISTDTQGEYPVQMMNLTGYDYAVFGNHEFDYGVRRLSQLTQLATAQYLNCNITYQGTGEDPFSKVKAYAIEDYDGTKVGFIGVTTPDLMSDCAPEHFMENGQTVYGFSNENAEKFYATVQAKIDTCLDEGADHVVLLTHLGDSAEYAPYSSTDLIENTVGVDAVLDGHAHNEIEGRTVENNEGEEVLLASTGTKLEKLGQLVIAPDGELSVQLITPKSGGISPAVAEKEAEYEQLYRTKAGESAFELSLYGADGARRVRNRETAIGNFCADAFRTVSGADVGFVNGGGIRASLPQGEMTYGDLLNVMPYGNTLAVIEMSGQEILDVLEFSCYKMQAEASRLEGEKYVSVAENGGFLQVSGLKFTVDASLTTSVVVDENGLFVSVGNVRRVKNVQVLGKDGFVPIEREKTYTVASMNFTLLQGGDGYTMLLDNQRVACETMLDYKVIARYLELCGGSVPATYFTTENRITVE